MLVHPQFDPIAFSLGPVAVRWYGLSYLAGFALFVWLARRRVAQPWHAAQGWTSHDVDDLLFWGVLGVIVGGRLGFVLFYQPAYYAAHPLEVFSVWKGGMAFHGGLLGVIAAFALYAWRRGRRFLAVTDLIAPCAPTGFALVRVANFVNGELWGRAADPTLPWAMAFPQSGSMVARHPSQLYQAALEGLTLFVLLWLYGRKPRPLGRMSAAFLVGYGTFRFVAEYFREPDAYLGLLSLGLSMGQWLCLPMILGGAALWAWSARQPVPGAAGRVAA